MLRYRKISTENSRTNPRCLIIRSVNSSDRLGGIVAIVAGTILALLIVVGAIYSIKIAGKATK